MTTTIGFIGAGNMAQAMIQSVLVQKGNTVLFFDPDASCRAKARGLGALERPSNAAVVKESSIIFLCTKPQYVEKLCEEEIGAALDVGSTIVVSIAAGVSTKTIEKKLPKGAKVVRIMPNLPCVVQSMAAGMYAGPAVTPADAQRVQSLLKGMGTTCVVTSEEQLDAVTGLSGSGPAYVFIMIEALADGGVRSGLPRNVALQLAVATVRGAAEMMLKSPSTHPGVFKDQVCSPGGTTIAGVAVMEARGVRGALIDTVAAATGRSRELSKM